MNWLAAALAISSAAAPAPARALPRDTTSAMVRAARMPRRRLFGRRDVAFLALSATAVAIAGHNDLQLTDEATEAHSTGENRLASLVQPLGNTGVMAPALIASYGLARWSHHDDAARAVMRVSEDVAAAGLVTLAVKEAVGRARPVESPGDATRFRPFSGHASFPSGHATIAFAAAAAISRETSSRWVPWLAYPTAALLGWSRVHDREHWTSDVLAGAAIGTWTAWKTDAWLRSHAGRASHFGLELAPDLGGAQVTLRF